MTLELRDFSVYQGSPDWNAVANSGLAGAIAKATEGVGFTDSQWGRKQAALLAPGPLVGGSYHFLRPDLGNDPVAEADWYLSQHDLRCFDPAIPWIFALDAEPPSGGSDGGCQAFMARVWARTGYPCWFYSYSAWIQSRGISAFGNPLWLAWPDGNGPNPPLLGWPVITMQQYGVASVPGVSGQVDANRFFGDRTALLALAGAAGRTPGTPVVLQAPPGWNGSYPMPDPPPASTSVDILYSGRVMARDGAGNAPRWLDGPDGQDMGSAPVGQTVTVDHAAFDGVNWFDRISPGSWWLLDSAIDGTDVGHPGGQTPVTAWNEAHVPVVPPPPAPASAPPSPSPGPGGTPLPAQPTLEERVADLERRVFALEAAEFTGG